MDWLNLVNVFQVISEGKKRAIESHPGKKFLKHLEEDLKQSNPFASQSNHINEAHIETATSNHEAIQVIGEYLYENGVYVDSINETISNDITPASQIHSQSEIDRYLRRNASFQQPDPPKVDPTIQALQDKVKFLEQAIGRIAATGPGSGEVNLRYLDDVKRDTIVDGRVLKYSAFEKKFIFDDINPYEVVFNTTEVTTSIYEVTDTDYYIGVRYAGATVTLPISPDSGRTLIVKDELGVAETSPITIEGTIDNDSDGAIIQMNNGSLTLIYRDGWRIV